ncbi:MAG: helix-turn-helix domain-containing protein [bacterium]
MPDLLSTKEAAEVLGVAERTVQRWISSSKIDPASWRVVRGGKTAFFTLSQVTWMKKEFLGIFDGYENGTATSATSPTGKSMRSATSATSPTGKSMRSATSATSPTAPSPTLSTSQPIDNTKSNQDLPAAAERASSLKLRNNQSTQNGISSLNQNDCQDNENKSIESIFEAGEWWITVKGLRNLFSVTERAIRKKIEKNEFKTVRKVYANNTQNNITQNTPSGQLTPAVNRGLGYSYQVAISCLPEEVKHRFFQLRFGIGACRTDSLVRGEGRKENSDMADTSRINQRSSSASYSASLSPLRALGINIGVLPVSVHEN